MLSDTAVGSIVIIRWTLLLIDQRMNNHCITISSLSPLLHDDDDVDDENKWIDAVCLSSLVGRWCIVPERVQPHTESLSYAEIIPIEPDTVSTVVGIACLSSPCICSSIDRWLSVMLCKREGSLVMR